MDEPGRPPEGRTGTAALGDGGPTSPAGEPRRDPAPAARGLLNLPNQLTIARLILSVVFFVLLALETHGEIYQTIFPWKIKVFLNAALIVFLLAIITDFLDGYLARKWGLVSTFGRIADPFADKIVICGGFIMLIGVEPRLVEPWFAVIIIFREFLVSGLRSFLESRGVAFGADWSGKLKMLVQSITIPLVIFYEANFAPFYLPGPRDAAGSWLETTALVFHHLAVAFLALTLVLTVASSAGYLHRAMKLIREDPRAAD
jgi:CDP-diacylglycerol--glycerol-3-phosphate 3-phosphatidyltransferase